MYLDLQFIGSEPQPSDFTAPRVCIICVWYVRRTESRYNILFLCITYYVCKARGKNGFSAEYIRSCGNTKSQTLGQI